MSNTENKTLYPDVHVSLVGEDGNAMMILARVSRALRRAGHGEAVADYMKRAMSGDYVNLLHETVRTVSVD